MYDGKKFFYKHAYSDLEGIPITKERLLKFGFEDFGKMPAFELYRMEIKNLALNIDNEGNVYTNELGIELKYIHQLQNLYYSLTGEELSIKEKVL